MGEREQEGGGKVGLQREGGLDGRYEGVGEGG